MNRRRFLEVSTITGITASYGAAAPVFAAQPAPPGATPVSGNTSPAGSLGNRMAAVSPEALMDALMSTPVTTPLFPADSTGATAEPWVDPSDEDLDGTIGAVSFVANGSDSTLLLGNATVFPDADTAAARFTALVPSPGQYRGLPWIQQGFGDYAISAVVPGPMILAGGAELPDDVRLDDTVRDPEPRQLAQLESRAVINMVALLDHLEDVLAAITS